MSIYDEPDPNEQPGPEPEMSKPIKEIGQVISRHPEDGGFVPFRESLDEKYHVCILTLEERRELVREAIYAFIMDYLDSYTASDALGGCIAKFYKDYDL